MEKLVELLKELAEEPQNVTRVLYFLRIAGPRGGHLADAVEAAVKWVKEIPPEQESVAVK